MDGLRDGVERTHAAQRSRRLLSMLAGVQLAVALVLLVGAALMVRSFLSIARIDAGFSRENVVTAQLPLPSTTYADAAKQKRFFTDLVERLGKAPGIEKAGAVLMRPLEIELGWDWTHTVEGQGAAEQINNPLANLISVTPGYLEAMGIPLIRDASSMSATARKAEKVMIVGRSFALRHWGHDAVIGGKRVKAGKFDSKNPWLRIVGVVGDVRYRGLTTEKLDVYHPYLQSTWTPQYIALRTDLAPAAAEGTLRSIVRSIDPTVPVAAVRTTSQLVDAKLAQPRLKRLDPGHVRRRGAAALHHRRLRGPQLRRAQPHVRDGRALALGARAMDLLRLVIRHAVVVSPSPPPSVAGRDLPPLLGSFLYGVARAEPMTLLLAAMLVILAASSQRGSGVARGTHRSDGGFER